MLGVFLPSSNCQYLDSSVYSSQHKLVHGGLDCPFLQEAFPDALRLLSCWSPWAAKPYSFPSSQSPSPQVTAASLLLQPLSPREWTLHLSDLLLSPQDPGECLVQSWDTKHISWTERNTSEDEEDMAGSEARETPQSKASVHYSQTNSLTLLSFFPLPEIHGTEVPTLSDH